MKNPELQKQLTAIKSLIADTSSARVSGEVDNFELQGHWARYLCILSAGFIENAVKELYIDYARRTVSGPIARFVESRLGGLRNPKSETILVIASQFKPDWEADLSIYMEDRLRGDAINSIMDNRHQIAHGKYKNSTVSISKIQDFLYRSVEVLEYIEKQCHT